MKKLILLVAVCLTGCATPPAWLASHYNSMDKCQRQNYGDKQPEWCGAAGNRTYVYRNNMGPAVGYVQR